jgi:hypothetical protein
MKAAAMSQRLRLDRVIFSRLYKAMLISMTAPIDDMATNSPDQWRPPITALQNA